MNQYENESQMRQAHPYLANHLATIATLLDGVYSATTGGKTYTWRAN
jgi:hypothetical protein